jgi:cysteine-rich repeat protein
MDRHAGLIDARGMFVRNRSILTVCLLSTACLSIGCNGGDDGDSGDEVAETDTSTETGDTDDDVDTETGDTGTTTDDDTTETTDDDVDTTTDDDVDTTETADDTTTDDTTETDDDTTETADGSAICGNSIIEGDEECDDGNLFDEDGCLSSCVNASCGDGFINMGVEACDDGTNDGSYGGCEPGCAALGPYCGDADINGPEECDDANEDLADGCQDNCVVPASCLTLIEYDDSLTDGNYQIAPDGYDGAPFDVWCDMTTDGGGYTFLKVDNGAQAYAVDAEAECDSWGMQLWIPRSEEHKNSGWAIANDGNVGQGSSPDYMRILGIYPDFNGAGCANQGMNSNNANCGWGASDGGPWYVHNVNNISEPNGDNSTTGSMYYQWQGNGQIQWHNDIPGVGYSSAFFMCDVGDKLP